MNIQELKQQPIIDFLLREGYEPAYVKGRHYWYLSPLRNEHTPSFKVNTDKNIWYDHGIGEGGTLIDLGMLYFNCSITDLLQRMSGLPASFSFHQQRTKPQAPIIQPSLADEKKDNPESKVVILDSRQLANKPLLDYLHKRSIPINIAWRFCREVDFLLYGKKQTVIGFPNDAGGYELRSNTFKGSSSPKAISMVKGGSKSDDVAVFEGFFSFLSFQVINSSKQSLLSDCLVLNSPAFFEKSYPIMEQYNKVHLLLDRDNAGTSATAKALERNKDKQEKYIDWSRIYQGQKDLNEWLINCPQEIKHSQGLKRSY